jgi:hypothetical protein
MSGAHPNVIQFKPRPRQNATEAEAQFLAVFRLPVTDARLNVLRASADIHDRTERVAHLVRTFIAQAEAEGTDWKA